MLLPAIPATTASIPTWASDSACSIAAWMQVETAKGSAMRPFCHPIDSIEPCPRKRNPPPSLTQITQRVHALPVSRPTAYCALPEAFPLALLTLSPYHRDPIVEPKVQRCHLGHPFPDLVVVVEKA